MCVSTYLQKQTIFYRGIRASGMDSETEDCTLVIMDLIR